MNKPNQQYEYLNGLVSSVQLTETGQAARFRKMRNRLSMFFDFCKNDSTLADNRNSKGRLVPVFITLTYPSNDDWNPEDVSSFTDKIRKYALRNWKFKLKIAWVAETTKSGVIHYHMITWIPRNKRLPKPSMPLEYNNRTYPPLWKYRAKVEGVRKGVYGYMLKYISKGCQSGGLGVYKDVDVYSHKTKLKQKGTFQKYKAYNFVYKTRRVYPRIFGYSGMTKKERERISYYMLPTYLRQVFGDLRVGDRIQRVKGGFQHKASELIEIANGHAYAITTRPYYQYNGLFPKFVPGNFDTFTMEAPSGSHYVGYEFGKNYSMLPEFQEPDEIWIPF